MIPVSARLSKRASPNRSFFPLVAALMMTGGACGPAQRSGPELVEGRLAILPFTSAEEQFTAAMNAAVTAAAGDVTGAETVPVERSGKIPVDAPLAAIASETGASMILRGTVSRLNGDITILAEIVDPTDENRKHVLPTETAPATNPSVAVERIASRTAGALAQHLDPDATAPWVYPAPTLEAYRVFQHADSLFAENAQAEALPYYYEAHALDTTFIAPLFAATAIHNNAGRGAVGDSLLREIEARADRLDDMQRYRLMWYRGNPEEALAAAEAAAQLDPIGWTYGVGFRANIAGHFHEAVDWLSRRHEQAEAGYHWARAWPAFRAQYLLALHATGDHETELAEAQLARTDFPDNAWWIFNEMMARAGLGQADVVLAQFDTTQMLLATNELPSYWEAVEDIAVELMAHGQAEAGQSLQEQVVDHYREVDNPFQLADALGFAGRPQEAFEVLAPVLADITTPDPIGWYGAAAAISGDPATAAQVLARLESLPSATTGNNLRYQAAIQGALGNCDRAIELYRQATEAGYSYTSARLEWWHRDWETQPVRANCPGFQTLLDKG
ncbi:MAG: hypothetical protein LJF04_00725 [Gemmatimonadetes bacterium]|nr:hypothetical protein [Gemmatimonadota bacterium]